MQWLNKVRAVAREMRRIPLPDPDRVEISGVRDTVMLLRAIDAAMPCGAVLEVIGPRHDAIAAFFAAYPALVRRNSSEFYLSVQAGAIADLARVAGDCPADSVCTHLFVYDGHCTLLEAFDRDRGEDVVWLSRRMPKSALRRFIDALEKCPSPHAESGAGDLVIGPASIAPFATTPIVRHTTC
jgi:hypothetical protein